jgi:hypothetical protein
MRSLLPAAVCCTALACAHGPTNEQRIDLVLAAGADAPVPAGDVRCRETAAELQLARDASLARPERHQRYGAVLTEVKATQAKLDELSRKDPDLLYGPYAEGFQQRVKGCAALVATLERERAAVEPLPEAPEVAAAQAPALEPKLAKSKTRRAGKARARAVDEPEEEEGASQLRNAYKKSAKVAKSKAKRRSVRLALSAQ